ncbi:hypothetical protein AWW67_11315 [Roseivirga seohaensis]|uniref:Uncharacterized protein n=1 Tax=Roseivirga seohaensis TaxID=1914963 RepID=A0A150XMI3_9BACT|nr:hypothetical protein [Roseivirga seohaensis]KYG79891.1 hypothetical protein AWW67_11315 [Roseivirga seohaensis]
MKTFINIILTVLIAFILGLFLPWWSVMIAGFIMGAVVGLKKASSFFVPFLAIALLWIVNAWFLAQPNDFTMTKKIAVLLPLEGNTFLLFLITGIIGGIAAGVAGVFGNQCKQLIAGKK